MIKKTRHKLDNSTDKQSKRYTNSREANNTKSRGLNKQRGKCKKRVSELFWQTFQQ